MILELPKKGRPTGVFYRRCDLGVDLPSEFITDIKGIDYNFFPIFHPYRILWDDFTNEYTGSLDDPRHSILENSFKAGELVMGYILTDGQEMPIPDGHWHIWRWCEPVRAWTHIVKLESREPIYLQLIVKKLYLQACYSDRFGHRGYAKILEEADFIKREKLIQEKRDLMQEIHKTNSAIMNQVANNFARGRVKPTKPQKEIIMGGGGIKRRDKIVRPLKAKEGGLILPDEFED